MRKMKFLKVTFKRGGGGCVTEYQADKQYDAYRHLANIHNYYFQCTFGTTTAHQYQLGHRPRTRGGVVNVASFSDRWKYRWNVSNRHKCWPDSPPTLQVILGWTWFSYHEHHHSTTPPPPISEYSLSLRCQKCCLLSNIAHCCRITKRDYLNGHPLLSSNLSRFSNRAKFILTF